MSRNFHLNSNFSGSMVLKISSYMYIKTFKNGSTIVALPYPPHPPKRGLHDFNKLNSGLYQEASM
jgi:hypothetical protein